MKTSTTKPKVKATTKTVAKATSKTVTKRTPVKKIAAKKTESAMSDKMEKLNKLERALAENQISKKEYEMWRNVYAKEVPFNPNLVQEEDPRQCKTKRRKAY